MAVEVRLPTVLRTHAGGSASIQADGTTLREVFDGLVAQYPCPLYTSDAADE